MSIPCFAFVYQLFAGKPRVIDSLWKDDERGGFMGEVEMLISGFVVKDGRKIVRVSFLRGKDYAEGILPDGMIEKSEGFTDMETRKLENYLRRNRADILQQAKEINPIRSWLKG